MAYDTGEPDARSSRWSGVLLLSLLLVVGWVLFELTAQPALGVAAVCIKFGWEDFRTAWWLRRSDARVSRACACFWLYVASGLWKIAITASVMIFAYIFLKLTGALPGKQAARHVYGSVLTAFGGIALATVTACWAVFLAFLGGDKLWLNHGVHRARRRNIWPPPGSEMSSNLAGTLLGTTLFAFGVPLLLAGMVAIIMNIGRAWLSFGLPVLAVAWALFLRWPIQRVVSPRLFAASPEECWQTAMEAPVPSLPAPVYAADEIAAAWRKPEISVLEERAQRTD